MKIENVEELLATLKSLEVSTHIWRIETYSAAEVAAIIDFYTKLHELLDNLMDIGVGTYGFKNMSIPGFRYISRKDMDILDIVEGVKDFLKERVRTPNGFFMPEVDAALVDIISLLTRFNYKMMLE